MTLTQVAELLPWLALLAPEPLRALLVALAEGAEELAVKRAREIARMQARGVAAGLAAAASSRATEERMRDSRCPRCGGAMVMLDDEYLEHRSYPCAKCGAWAKATRSTNGRIRFVP